MKIIQNPIPPTIDLRDMVRQHMIARSLVCMEKAAKRRQRFLQKGRAEGYSRAVRNAVGRFYGQLPVGKNGVPVKAAKVSSFQKDGYCLENLLFESFPGWQVNATVYVPLNFNPPFPAVVVAVGHSGKQFPSYQLPAQFFARCGYLTIVFDPPGQASEKREGNDHFIDGVRCYLVGETSSRYFVADALRCIDYLETRNDVDLSNGVAMTGVSGGGTTTTFAVLLDDRISVIGPSCCLSPLAVLDITQCYAGCPETHMWRRYAEGVDEIDLLCAAFPKPILLIAGKFDEVFSIEDTQKLAKEVKVFFEAFGHGDRFKFFVDDAGHCYSLIQARQFVSFMNQWLLRKPDKIIPELPDSIFTLDPYEELQCHPRTDVNIRSLTLSRAFEIEKTYDHDPERIRNAAKKIAGIKNHIALPKSNSGLPFRVWTHYWQQILLKPEKGIELPATFLYAEKNPAATILHFDDAGRHHLLYRNGILTQSARFGEDNQLGFNLFTVDLRGWGDSSPAMYPYELASWGGVDRYLAYMSAALGDSLMAMRIRDGLKVLTYLRSRSEVDPTKIIITGNGLGGIIALHVAAIDTNLQGVVLWDSLGSFKTLLETENYTWSSDTFIPQILLYYDLPELVTSLDTPVFIFNALDGAKQPLSPEILKKLNRKTGRQVYRKISESNRVIIETIQFLMKTEGHK